MVIREFVETDRAQATALLKQQTNLAQHEIDRVLQTGQRFVVLQGESVSGIASLAPGHPGFYSLFILVDEKLRRQGIGGALWQQLMSGLSADAEMVCCACPAQKAEGQAFLRAKSFASWFSEEVMHYTGPILPDPQLTARAYTDADFESWARLINDSFYPLREAHDIRPHVIFDLDSQTARQRLAESSDQRLFFYAGDQLVGLAGISGTEIDPIAVAADQRRKGYGHQIAVYCTNYILSRNPGPATLTVVPWNVTARKLYEDVGYRLVQKHNWFRLLLS